MNKLKMHSINKVEVNIERIGELFPNCLTERKNEKGEIENAIDFDVLKQELSSNIVESQDERYQFTWPNKKNSILLSNSPILKTLRPIKNESLYFDKTENIYIEGDNLDALKLLQETYLGKVKMIYIDPPYNTGNDFVYEDDFAQSTSDYLEYSGQYDDTGNRLVQNTENNGRFHTDWLNMIYPRLKVAKDLLADNGVICISIDDCEQGNLKKICDEIFGAENFVDTIIWKKRYGGGAKEKYLVSLHEYVLIFCKNINLLNNFFVPLSLDSINRYYNKKDEKFTVRGGYRTHPLEAGKAMDSRPNLIYPILAPDGTKIMPKRQWLWSKDRTYEALANNELEILRGNNEDWVVSTKQYLYEEDGSIRQGKMLSIIDDVYTQHGTNEMISIFGNAKIFNYPKPSNFIKKLVTVISENMNDIILDFYSGSATTAHAVIKLNSEDGGDRKFIMVQLPEETDEKSEAYKAGYKNICEIGKERIKRAGEKIKEEVGLAAQNLDIGFRVLKVDSTNMKDVFYKPEQYKPGLFDELEDNIKEDRTPLDLLFQVMLEMDVLLSSKIEEKEISGKKVFSVMDDYLIACFDKGISKEVVEAIAKTQPYYAVFRDSCMEDDSTMTSFEQIFETYSKETIRKIL